MASVSETALQALIAALGTTGATIERNTPIDLALSVPAGGLIIVRDGNPGEPEIVLGQMDYQYEHEAEVEVYLQTVADRLDAEFDDLRIAVGEALVADRRLGGAVMWTEPRPSAAVDLPKTSELPIKATSIAVVLTYSSPVPIN